MSDLTKYNGTWGKTQVVHLLKRTMFGAKSTDIAYFLNKNLSDSVDELLTMPSKPAPPINHYEGKDVNGSPWSDSTGIAKGATWVNANYGDGTTNFFRGVSLTSWWLGNMANQTRSIQEKMVLFWHSHFCTELKTGGGATAAYRLVELFRTYAISDLPTLMVEVSKNPQMLHYLNGYLNTKFSPDENYGRELQELFGIGKGPGSQYTEDDVREAAKVLTGLSLDWVTQTFLYRPELHETSNKTFSSFYGGATITGRTSNAGLDELTDLINMIVSTDECPKFIIRKIYRFFVNYDITSQVETDIIEPLATLYKNNSFNLQPVLKKLFESEHFYDECNVGVMIKSPIDLLIGFLREGNTNLPSISNVDAYYTLFTNLYYAGATMLQQLGDTPNVAGWPAYYQTPAYYKHWINTDTLPKRVNNIVWFHYGGYDNVYNVVDFAKQFSNSADPNTLLNDIFDNLYMIPVSTTTKSAIKTAGLLTGQAQDYYWTNAWNDYINDPSNASKYQAVYTRLLNVMNFIVQSSEYQLM